MQSEIVNLRSQIAEPPYPTLPPEYRGEGVRRDAERGVGLVPPLRLCASVASPSPRAIAGSHSAASQTNRLPLSVIALLVILCGAFGPLVLAADDPANAAAIYRQAFESMADPTDPHWDLVEHPDAVRIDPSVAKFVARHDETFALLRKAAAAPECDWGTDLRQGLAAKLPHLAPARKLANLTRLRARVLVQQGRAPDALGDAAALLALARYLGSEPLILSKLIECGVGDSAVEAAAGAVMAALPADMKSLLDHVDHLPKSVSASEAVRREGAAVAAQLRDVAKGDADAALAEGGVLWEATGGPRADPALRAALRAQWTDPRARDAAVAEVAALFDAAAGILAAPFEKSFVTMQKWEARRAAASPLARALVPSLQKYRVAVAAAETRAEMLYVAAQVRRDGPAAAANSREPHADGPFAYHALADGFELESSLVVDNVPVRVTCRKSGDELPF